MIFRQAWRVFRREGWRSLFAKAKKKAALYQLQKTPHRTTFSMTGGTMNNPNNTVKNWLQDNRNNFGNPFYNLLNFLVAIHEDIDDIEPVSCNQYREYLQTGFLNEMPFPISLPEVEEEEDIVSFINAFDRAYLHKMIHGVFVGLIGYLTQQKANISLLDFGTGASCGLYGGPSGRALFDRLDTRHLHFVGIDNVHKPGGSVFNNATYIKSDILSFTSERKFDLITGHHVLEHCYNWETVMAHLHLLLQKGGYAYLSFPRFGGFYDTTYRLMAPLDHCASFDLDTLRNHGENIGLKLCLADVYTDPNFRFNWMCNLLPDLIDQEIADCFYDLCVRIDAKKLLGLHLYGNYVIFQKM